MGMFDSFRDERGNEWQTKAYDCQLRTFRRGDSVPHLQDQTRHSYQVTVLGDSGFGLATILYRNVVEVPADRDESFPLIDYFGSEVP